MKHLCEFIEEAIGSSPVKLKADSEVKITLQVPVSKKEEIMVELPEMKFFYKQMYGNYCRICNSAFDTKDEYFAHRTKQKPFRFTKNGPSTPVYNTYATRFIQIGTAKLFTAMSKYDGKQV